jgi:predicted nucleic-acid-binding Zn-ribbon protein
MVHCPECTTTLQNADDVAFVDTDSEMGIVTAAKRFYTIECAHCGAAIGGGVAGAQGNGGAA